MAEATLCNNIELDVATSVQDHWQFGSHASHRGAALSFDGPGVSSSVQRRGFEYQCELAARHFSTGVKSHWTDYRSGAA